MEETLKLASPWVTLFRELNALFKYDPEVKVELDNDKKVITVRVENSIKSDAIAKLLPKSKTFGKVKVDIKVIPANKEFDNTVEIFKAAFNGNPALSRVLTLETALGHFDFAMFKNEVVQYQNDNGQDPYGYTSTLYENIIRDVTALEDICFSTEGTIIDGNLVCGSISNNQIRY